MTRQRRQRRQAPEGQRIRRTNRGLHQDRRGPVIAILYTARRWCREIGITLPRVELRITEATNHEHRRVLGVATLGRCEIFISESAFEQPGTLDLAATVLHEVVHAVTGFRHDAQCPLMAPTNAHQFTSEAELQRVFLSYFEN